MPSGTTRTESRWASTLSCSALKALDDRQMERRITREGGLVAVVVAVVVVLAMVLVVVFMAVVRYGGMEEGRG